MAFLTETEVRRRAAQVMQRRQKSAGSILFEDTASTHQRFDVFLSHSSAEPEHILLGIKAMLEDRQLSVYVDKYSDPQLSPEDVTPDTANLLRDRMRSSNVLIYVYSQHSKASRWMPWELGFFDGLKGAVGILPITLDREDEFEREEYLGLYPYVDVALGADSGRQHLWIRETAGIYARLDLWATGKATIRPHP